DWYESWKTHLAQYLNNPPRTGIYIHAKFPKISSSLEIASGSSRDSVYLAKKKVEATASDYEDRVIDDLRKRFVYRRLKYQQADAFNLPFNDNTFDLVFHNGFFIYFKKDLDITIMLIEQARVARKYVVFFVHNKMNYNLVQQFKELAPKDPIYDIRFFEPDEVERIASTAGIDKRSVKIFKFGGKYDRFYSKRLRRFIPNPIYPFRTVMIPHLYDLQNWEDTERIGCLIELDK
ncbi:MAG TPA: class I SAM-dependent methyltransferase, partial [Salinivirgaceae bacterium]|nr:class I SAM-dependent methyltransferase [Salinivirgaceae bacterium]